MDNCFSNFELVNLNKFHELARGKKKSHTAKGHYNYM